MALCVTLPGRHCHKQICHRCARLHLCFKSLDFFVCSAHIYTSQLSSGSDAPPLISCALKLFYIKSHKISPDFENTFYIIIGFYFSINKIIHLLAILFCTFRSKKGHKILKNSMSFFLFYLGTPSDLHHLYQNCYSGNRLRHRLIVYKQQNNIFICRNLYILAKYSTAFAKSAIVFSASPCSIPSFTQ